MSIYKYDSTQDELTPLAGQGKAEYGASGQFVHGTATYITAE